MIRKGVQAVSDTAVLAWTFFPCLSVEKAHLTRCSVVLLPAWFKYYEGDFTQPGIDGESTPIESLMSVQGANPSVHYNMYLEMWVMVFHSWGGCLYISSSPDAYEWSEPQEVLCSEHEGGKTWYPTIIGESDVLAGEKARLYYADMYDGKRDFIGQEIVFTRADDDEERRVVVSEERLSQSSVDESLETSAITSGESSSAKSVLKTTMLSRSIFLLGVAFFASIRA
jgi:hypothetical protein